MIVLTSELETHITTLQQQNRQLNVSLTTMQQNFTQHQKMHEQLIGEKETLQQKEDQISMQRFCSEFSRAVSNSPSQPVSMEVTKEFIQRNC